MKLFHSVILSFATLFLSSCSLPALNNSDKNGGIDKVASKIFYAQELKKLGLSQEEIVAVCSKLLTQELAEQGEPEVAEKGSTLLLYAGITVAVLSVGGLAYWLIFSKPNRQHNHTGNVNNCNFCRIINHQDPAVVLDETETMIAIEKRPIRRPTDCLIIPKRHVENVRAIDYSDPAEQQILAEVGQMAQRLSERLNGNGHFTLTMNNGRESGQTVFHLHAHFRSPDVWR